MIVHIYEDEFGYIIEPHGEEESPRWISNKGQEMLCAAGWHYVDMHRCSRYLFDILTKLGHVKPLSQAPKLYAKPPVVVTKSCPLSKDGRVTRRLLRQATL